MVNDRSGPDLLPSLPDHVVRPAGCWPLQERIVFVIKTRRGIQDTKRVRESLAPHRAASRRGCARAHGARIENLIDGITRILEVQSRGAIRGRRNRGDELASKGPKLAFQQRAYFNRRLRASVETVIDRIEVDALRVAPVRIDWQLPAFSTHSRFRREHRRGIAPACTQRRRHIAA